jgi:hypothetical protein
MKPKTSLAFLSLMLAGGAIAQPAGNQPDRADRREDGTLRKAGEIASQPAKDVGITKTKIPAVLLDAVDQPYALPRARTCKGYTSAISDLNEALGPDFDANAKKNQDKFGRLASAGGEAVVNSLIPFRGLVREVSGAAPAERRLGAAINAGVARRGFLRGMAQSKGCKLPAPPKA